MKLSAHVILYVEPTIISVQKDTNAMLYCKVIDALQNHAHFLKTMVTDRPPFSLGPVRIIAIAQH